jgi:hypothetical protein
MQLTDREPRSLSRRGAAANPERQCDAMEQKEETRGPGNYVDCRKDQSRDRTLDLKRYVRGHRVERLPQR